VRISRAIWYWCDYTWVWVWVWVWEWVWVWVWVWVWICVRACVCVRVDACGCVCRSRLSLYAEQIRFKTQRSHTITWKRQRKRNCRWVEWWLEARVRKSRTRYQAEWMLNHNKDSSQTDKTSVVSCKHSHSNVAERICRISHHVHIQDKEWVHSHPVWRVPWF